MKPDGETPTASSRRPNAQPAGNPWDEFYDVNSEAQTTRRIDPRGIIDMLGISGDDTALQIGCGTGDHVAALRLAIPGIRAYGIDWSQRAMALRTVDSLVRADMRALPFRSQCFSRLFAFGVIEHVPETSVVVSEIARVAREGASVLFSVPNKRSCFHVYKSLLMAFDSLQLRRRPLWKLGYEKSFSVREMRELFASHGFVCCRTRIISSAEELRVGLRTLFKRESLRSPKRALSNLLSLAVATGDFALHQFWPDSCGFFIYLEAQMAGPAGRQVDADRC